MPHQCTNCGCVFQDGSKEMLSGCPECEGTTFQFRPEGAADVPTAEEPPQPEGGSVGAHVGRATSMVRGLFSGGESTDSPGPTEAVEQSEPGVEGDADLLDSEDPDDREDSAQASARSEFVSPDQLPSHSSSDASPSESSPSPSSDSPSDSSGPPSEGRIVREPTDEQPDLSELRAELNDQFESIKILEPGQYELNLMELYDREAYIIALQENGHYAIQMPETWLSEDD